MAPSPSPPVFFTGLVSKMADASKIDLLQGIFDAAATPEELQHFIVDVLKIATVTDFIQYVVRKDYQEEWKEIIAGAFPVRAAAAAREATEESLAVAAVGAFTLLEQRTLIAKIRATYKVAFGHRA